MRALGVGAVTVVLLPVVLVGAAVGGFGGIVTTSANAPVRASADIPAPMLALYTDAAARFEIPVALLAAVGKVECDHGRDPRCAVPNAAGALGPMQFLPATFARYASAAGSATPAATDPRDAVFAAAAKLAADGVARDPLAALRAYNPAAGYPATVVAWAIAYGWEPADPRWLASAVLTHPHLGLRPEAAADVAAGRVDARVLALLLVLATSHHLSSVGPFVTGHGLYVEGTARLSNHVFGRAVDLPVVDGAPVSGSNAAAREVVDAALGLVPPLRPDELGCPWVVAASGVRTFTAGHADHVHLGFDA